MNGECRYLKFNKMKMKKKNVSKSVKINRFMRLFPFRRVDYTREKKVSKNNTKMKYAHAHKAMRFRPGLIGCE